MEIITNENTGIVLYANLLIDIKTRIRQAQVKATLSANAEMIMMYCDIGRIIHKRQQQEGWSAAIIPHLSRDLRNELPEVKGFSERNLGRMLAFFRNYQAIDSFLPQPVAKLPSGCELTRALSENLKSSLPSIEELEAKLSGKEYISDEKHLQIKRRGRIDERFTVN